MVDHAESIQKKIRSFQKKYYLNIFIKGCILTLTGVFIYFLVAILLEHNLWLSHWFRLLIFLSFFGLVIGFTYKFLGASIRWLFTKKGLGEEQSAKIIGESLPDIKDRLLNLIQLKSLTSSDLAQASIQQKSGDLYPISFDSFIHVSENKKYLRYLLIPLSIILIILIFNQSIITQSTTRIIHFNREYTPEAPFKFNILNNSLNAYYNEDFTLKLKLTGNALPENIYLVTSQRVKMEQAGPGEFSYTFENIQSDFSFQLEGAGYYSNSYGVTVIHRPELIKFNIDLQYPAYLQRKNETLANAGNLEIPEGTFVKWRLNTLNAKKASISFASNNQNLDFNTSTDQSFLFAKKFLTPDQYQITLENGESKSKEKISYRIDVIKDEFPSIVVNNFKDSILYKRIILGGSVSDDYGITQLTLNFKIKDISQKDVLNQSANITISKNHAQQNFFYNWSLDSLKLKPGDQLEYYMKVWDNDGVNGRKSTRSASYTFAVPSEDELVTNIDKSRKQAEQKLDQSVGKADKLQDQIEDAYQKLKGKQNLDWQDKKMLEDIVQQKKNLDQAIEQIKEQNKLLQEKKEAFTEQDERIKEKADQIQKLMNELLDEETKKLFEELQKLLKENADASQIQKLLDKLNQNTSNLEKELDRMLELFKEVEYETKLDLAIEKLKEQVQDQKSLLEKTESLEKNISENKAGDQKEIEEKQSGLANQQQQLKEDFEKTTERIDELKKLQNELGKDEDMPSKENSNEIKKEQQDSKEFLEQNKPSKAKESQQKALKKLQQMQQEMEGMQSSMEMEMDMENIESLRQIIHGLIKLSFDQESLIKKFGELQQNDPQFNSIAQQQLRLKDDSKVLEDSLLSMSKKDPFMGSFVIKEIGNLNGHLDKVTEANKERRRPQASNEMQLSMTALNNLALMLDDHYDMMMQMMANAKSSSMKMSKKKGKGKEPSLSQMQQQLNDKIQQLKNSGKTGRQLSEELAESAAEQERIRRALQDMQEKIKNGGKSPGGDINNKMEQTELDLVNKQLTDQLIKRQKEILTRLLETEKSSREQEMDNERKGEAAKDYEKEIPKAFEEYLRLKEKEVELLKTVPPKLYPYYKKEVGEYFKRTGN